MATRSHNCPHTSEIPHSRDARPQYSSLQIRAYISFIRLPAPYSSSPLLADKSLARDGDLALPFLAALMRYHMAKIPFENVSLHYSQARVATLDVADLYERMVKDGKGRGGYCFQQNTFFGTVLRCVGFEVMSIAARVNTACEPCSRNPNYPGPSHNPWDHMANVVTIGSKDYLIDVGMHAWGPVVPVEIKHVVSTSVSPREIRLLHACIPEHVSHRDSNHVWHFEVRNGKDQSWIPTYSFSMMEFLPVDFEVLNWWTSANKKSWFTSAIVCGKLILSDDGSEVIGDLTLFGTTLRKRVHGKMEFELECMSEEERVSVMEKYLGIKTSSSERDAIRMTQAEIP